MTYDIMTSYIIIGQLNGVFFLKKQFTSKDNVLKKIRKRFFKLAISLKMSQLHIYIYTAQTHTAILLHKVYI